MKFLNWIISVSFRRKLYGVDLPEFGRYATGLCFLDKQNADDSQAKFAALANEIGLKVH